MNAAADAHPCPDPAKRYKNKAHQRAFRSGWEARAAGKSRYSPYGAADRTSAYFRRAWLAAYDELDALMGNPPCA